MIPNSNNIGWANAPFDVRNRPLNVTGDYPKEEAVIIELKKMPAVDWTAQRF